MKALKWKSVAIAAIVLAISYAGTAYAGDRQTGKAVSLREERLAVNKDLNKINQQQAEIKGLKKDLKQERSKGLSTASTRNELSKARADLRRDRAYLRADAFVLAKEHWAHLKAHVKDVIDARAELRREKQKLNADLRAGKASAVSRTEAVVNARQNVKQSEKKLDIARKQFNSDFALIFKESFDANGTSAMVLSVEDKTAKAQARK